MTLETIIPFEPISTTNIPKGNQWISQIKWDGVRILTYFDGESVKLYNRKKRDRTNHYPEIMDIYSYCKANSIILDGEVIALGEDGTPSFHDVMRRDGIKRLEKVKVMKSIIPIIYMVFDVLYINGQWVTNKTLYERGKLLEKILIPNQQVQLVDSYSNIEQSFKAIQEHELEGIVIKDMNSSYMIAGKDQRWQKLKNYQDIIAVIGGFTYRDGIINSILIGLYDDKGNLWYIGHVGTGHMTKKDWRELTKKMNPFIQHDMSFVNPPNRIKSAVWVKPMIAIKVQFLEWTEGNTLRQPSIQAFVDVPIKECKFEQ